ncbi:MAG TPA: hypothetical protein VGB18_05845 [Candidatus Thermoplasmatota archaeon]
MDGGPSEKAVAKFLAYFELVKAGYLAETNAQLEMYKPTDEACLSEKFELMWASERTGAAFVAELMNVLVWGQCLGNGNHRTSTLFVRTFLEWAGVEFPSPTIQNFSVELDVWINRSQALIRRRGEPGFAQARLAPKHQEITEKWVNEMLAGQSAALTMVGSQRLMDFISHSETRG